MLRNVLGKFSFSERPSGYDSAEIFGSPSEAMTPEIGMEKWWSCK